MLPLGYDINCNYSYGCSQLEPFCSRLVGLHTIFLCRCDFLLSPADLPFALGSYSLQLIVFGILTGATIDPISKQIICVELGFFLHLMLPLRYDSNCNYSYGCSQWELFFSKLVGPHTILRKPLCRCDFQLSYLPLVCFRILSFTINGLWNPYPSDNRPHQQVYYVLTWASSFPPYAPTPLRQKLQLSLLLFSKYTFHPQTGLMVWQFLASPFWTLC